MAADRPAPSLADGLLEVGWLLIALLVPLGVNLWARQPFDPPKVALLRTLVWLMAGVWLADLIRRGHWPWPDLKGNPLLWPALGVAVAVVLSTLLAEDPGLSLWGSYERAQGALTLLSYVLLFLLVSARMRTLDQARRLVAIMALSGAPIVLLGLAQAAGLDPFGLVSDARSPIYVTLGRSNFVGAYLAMLLPLTLALTLTARFPWGRLLGALLIGGEGIVLLLSLARGAWLAAAVAVGGFALLWFWPRLTRSWRRTAAMAGLAGVGAALAGLLWLGRQGGSAAARLTIWRATLELIRQCPVLGYGPDAMGLGFSQVYPPQLVYYQGRGMTIDRAHNLLLDWLVSGGIVGLLPWLALLASFFFVGWRAIQRTGGDQRRPLLVACLAATAGNVAGNMVGFDVPATATATWLLMAVVVALSRPGQPALVDHGATRAEHHPPGWAAIGMVGTLAVLICATVIQFNVRPLVADMAAQVADERASTGNWQGAIQAGEEAVGLWPVEPAHHLALSWAYLQQARTGLEDPLPWLLRAEAELHAARTLRPGDYHAWVALGELYAAWGTTWDDSKLPLAHAAYRQATELAPNQAMVYTAWGLLEMQEGRPAQAAARFATAVDLDATDGHAFAHLGNAQLEQGHVEEALAAFAQAVHRQPELAHAHLGLARCYWQLGQKTKARQALEEALKLDPANAAAIALRREMGLGP